MLPSTKTNSLADSGTSSVRPFSSKNRSLRTSASRFSNRNQQQQPDKRSTTDNQFLEEIQQLGDVSDQLNIRVRERATGTEERPRSRLGSLIFKNTSESGAIDSGTVSTSGGGLASSLEQKASELKGTITRPLSSLFRRSHSHDRSASHLVSQQHQQQKEQFAPNNSSLSAHASITHAQQSSSRPTPTARGPLTNNGYGTSTTTPLSKPQNSNGIGNGTALTATPVSTTTTATRPFSGFPGKRSAAAAASQQTSNEASNISQPEIDLSEQAAIVPHVNVRRFSGFFSNEPKSIFPTRVGQQHSSQLQNAGTRANAGEIDVNFLSRFLCPNDEIHDQQVPWNWDSLFASVTSELREEWALEEEANNNIGDMMGIGNGNNVSEGMLIPNGLHQQQRGM